VSLYKFHFTLQVKLSPEIITAHNEVLSKHNMIIPYKKTAIKTFNVNANNESFEHDELFAGEDLYIGFRFLTKY